MTEQEFYYPEKQPRFVTKKMLRKMYFEQCVLIEKQNELIRLLDEASIVRRAHTDLLEKENRRLQRAVADLLAARGAQPKEEGRVENGN